MPGELYTAIVRTDDPDGDYLQLFHARDDKHAAYLGTWVYKEINGVSAIVLKGAQLPADKYWRVKEPAEFVKVIRDLVPQTAANVLILPLNDMFRKMAEHERASVKDYLAWIET